MTRDDINRMLDVMAAEAASSGDPAQGPGAIKVHTDAWVPRLSDALTPRTCESLSIGMRYRGIRVLVARIYETSVVSRGEIGEAGEPFRELTAA